jgi:hypothetical protein
VSSAFWGTTIEYLPSLFVVVPLEDLLTTMDTPGNKELSVAVRTIPVTVMSWDKDVNHNSCRKMIKAVDFIANRFCEMMSTVSGFLMNKILFINFGKNKCDK